VRATRWLEGTSSPSSSRSDTLASVDNVKVAAVKVAKKVVGADPPLPLPETRAQLLALHEAARRRRDAAPPASRERADASFEIERIEIQVARIERAMDPPLV
jgi:hypothetical protein